MKVTGHLTQPGLAPCPNSTDITAAQPTTAKGMPGHDQCSVFDRNKNMSLSFVPLDTFNPEKFKYDQYRYQLFARPSNFDCKTSSMTAMTKPIESTYQPAYTDVRALEQTMYIPIVPSKPGGETEITFPMTPRTMGQPDVTSACCVPVIPSQPGYRNLTQGILPGPCSPLSGPVNGAVPSAGGQGCPYMRQMGGSVPRGPPGYAQTRNPPAGCGCARCSPQTMRPPSNVPGGACLGLPDTFPKTEPIHSGHSPTCNYARQMAPIASLKLPHYTGQMPAQLLHPTFIDPDNTYDGLPRDKICTSMSAIRYQDRVQRAVQKSLETPSERARRMREVYGHHGSHLVPIPYQKRHDLYIRPGYIKQQGNGFTWDYPRNTNHMCYVLKRNQRCS